MPELNDIPKELSSVARDAAYVVVGLGVLGLQRAQVQRQTLQKKVQGTEFDKVVRSVRQNLGRTVRELDEAVEQGFRHVETAFEPLEEQLPTPLRSLVDQAQSSAREVRGQIRQLVEAAV